jgi:phosphosulfolactate phosphohydrolase-like enzyme
VALVPTDPFAQAGYHVRSDWGGRGLATLAACTVIVVVDVFSFCTAVDVAISRGASVRPVRWEDQPVVEPGLLIAGERGRGRLSLSPVSLLDLPAGARLALTVISALLSAGCWPASPEALAAADSFDGAHQRGLQATLASCGSGRELIAAGYDRDVELAAQHDVSTTVAILREGTYQA